MAQFQVTVDEDVMRGLFQRDDGLARLVEAVVEQILEAQVTEQLQAKRYERTEDRQGYRNGYRCKELKTRIGTLQLRVPRVRNGEFSTELFARYQRSEQALVLALMEMVINGVSTRKVRRITEELCGTSFSKSTVSDLCKQLDPLVAEWNERPLEGPYPFLIVDALVLKVRKGGRVRAQSVLLAVGINQDGYREVLGLQVGDSESEDSWSRFFQWLKGRGLRGVDLVVSDDHRGLVKAVQRHFQGASWQRLSDAPDPECPGCLPEGVADRAARSATPALRCPGSGDRPADPRRHPRGLRAACPQGRRAPGGGLRGCDGRDGAAGAVSQAVTDHQQSGAPQPGDPTAGTRDPYLSQRGVGRALDRCPADGAGRGVAHRQALR